MNTPLTSRLLHLGLLLALTFSTGNCTTPPPEEFDATPPRRDSGVTPFDASGSDSATGRDAATGTDSATGHDSATGTDSATGFDSSADSDAGTISDASTFSGDGALAPGRGEPCTQGSCNAPYTCVIPQGQTEGFCLEACQGRGSCNAGVAQTCTELAPSIPGTFCLDVQNRGESCFNVFESCSATTECYVTDQDQQGNPTAALCKETCDPAASTSTCANNAESCLSSGYVDLKDDGAGNPVLCDSDPTVCTPDHECLSLRTRDGRTIKACAKKLGWCGNAGGPGDMCDTNADQYCAAITDPLPNNGQDPAQSLCGGVCWYICHIPAALSPSGQDVTYDCPTSMACVAGPAGFLPDGVLVCDHGFDAGVPDAAPVEDANVVVDAAAGADANTSLDAGTACQPCGNTTFIGECGTGTEVLTWCDNSACLRSVDCAVQTVSGTTLHCAEFNTSWGFDCLAGTGEPCNPDYPAQPTNPAAPTSPGCDPSMGVCDPVSFSCQASVDAGVAPDAAGTDASAGGCTPCVLNNNPVDSFGACDGNNLVWCDANSCLKQFDCTSTTDSSRTCQSGNYRGPNGAFTWFDCMGAAGASCDTVNAYFTALNQGQTVGWLCDPNASLVCNPGTNVCE